MAVIQDDDAGQKIQKRLSKYVDNLKPIRNQIICRPPFSTVHKSCYFLSQLKESFRGAGDACHKLKSDLFEPKFVTQFILGDVR